MVAERRSLYAASDVLSQPPLLEPTPVYPSSGLTLSDAAARLPEEYRGLPDLAQKLLGDSGIRLWKHQWESLRTVLEEKSDLVVTTGTGSGKTECFLLPVLAELARESESWPVSPVAPDGRKWWNDENVTWQSQWAHSARSVNGLHAVRAMVLYPLNALVEDQLRRLRQTLDSDEVLRWLDSRRGGNRVTFGRYTGATPVPGVPTNNAAVQRLRDRLRAMADESDAVRNDPDLPPEARYYFPNVDGGEMWSRWDMQETPPDIFITNYHMLNIMLMRQVETSIFEKTRNWLKSDPTNRFFLIVDELHSYRGTAGTEVAYILRLLLQRLGLSVDSDQLAFLATSASIDDTPKSRQFLREFFGRDSFKIVSEAEEQPEVGAHRLMSPYRKAFEDFADKVQAEVLNPMAPPEVDSPETREAMIKLARSLDQSIEDDGEPAVVLAKALTSAKADHSIRDACMVVSGKIRATKVPDLDEVLFSPRGSNDVASDAMRGLLLALGMSRHEANSMSPQPVRGHLFYHNVQNMWVCVNPECDETWHLGNDLSDDGPTEITGPVGALHIRHRLACSCGGRVLDLLVCEVCGEILLGGYRGKAEVSGTPIEILTADLPNIADMPRRVSEDRKYGQYAVFWPLHNDEAHGEPEDVEFTHSKIGRRWARARLNVKSGQLIKSAGPTGPSEIQGWNYTILGGEADQQDALPAKCPRCDADYRRRNLDTPLRLHRTGFQKACQVVSGALAREMPMERGNRPGRKLLIFTDSRQDAAKLASGMEQDHYRDMVRKLLLKALDEYWGAFEAAMRHGTRLAGGADKLTSINDKLGKALAVGNSDRDQYLASLFDPGLNSELLIWLLGGQSNNPDALQTLLNMIRDYPGRVPLTSIMDKVKQEFLQLGFNPGGNGYNISQYTSDGVLHQWHECYSWSGTVPQEKAQLPPQAVRLLSRIDDSLTSELMFTLFQHTARTLEGLGAGWATLNPPPDAEESEINAVESVIRQLGVRRRYTGQPYFWGALEIPNSGVNLPRKTRDFLEAADVDEEKIVNILRNSGVGVLDDQATLGISPRNIFITKPTIVEGRTQADGWRCPKCNAFYLHPTGRVSVCPDCQDVQLRPDSKRENFDYYVYLAEQSGPVFRLHCEELTGQTDDGDRPKRQRRFQEVFVGNEKDVSRMEGVDLLSVTTTMEAGVDIGALESVVMANMPPRRFNYQQRVGRAGRRGAGVSLAVTFCRGRSHDDYYYQRTEEITGDPPPPPYVDMGSETILKRVFVKELLRLAFLDVGSSWDDGFRDSVHGEFGPAEEWTARAGIVKEWLNSPDNEATILGILENLRTGTKWEGEVGRAFCEKMLSYAKCELVQDISEKVDDPNYRQDALSERLAHAGLLPMFGFPTDARLLFTRGRYSPNPWPPLAGTVDRGLDVAISQFAPGSQIVKDKAVHTACGVATFYPLGKTVRLGNGFDPPMPQTNDRPLSFCGECKSIQYRENMTDLRPCEVCDAVGEAPIDAREPTGFFTDFQPEDYTGVFEWTPRSTLPALTWGVNDGDKTSVGNCDVLSFSDDILSINDNNGTGGFGFQRASIRGYGRGAYAVEPRPDSPISVAGDPQKIALLARRRTDILVASVRSWPEGVFADPRSTSGRAAWYSFSFFLRSASAAVMDVDTQELNAGFRPTRENGEVMGQTFLSDTLQNGAGYCWWLGQSENFEKVLKQGDSTIAQSIASLWSDGPHSEECDTSCNRCLRDFYNLPYHGVLDWRLAIDMARLAYNPLTAVDLNSPWSDHGNPWWLLCDGENAQVPVLLENLGFSHELDLNGLLTFSHQPLKRVGILRHPLWTDEHPLYRTAKFQAEEIYKGYTVQPLNPFEVIRHPAGILAPQR